MAENTSVNFLLLGSIVSLVYLMLAFMMRKATGRGIPVEHDGILGV